MRTRVGLAVNSQKCLEFDFLNDKHLLSNEPGDKTNEEIVSEDDSQKLQRSIFGLGDEKNSFISLDAGNLDNGTKVITNELGITQN